jgi:acetyl esterase/lipase
MVKLYKPCIAWLCLAVSFFAVPHFLQAQTHTPRVISINDQCGGYYEYLPEGYQSSGAPYPLIVYLHGMGHQGNGSTDLPLLLEAGIPQYINDGLFPRSFVVNNQSYRFIIISPQFNTWPTPSDVEAVISYAVAMYNVDTRRIYVTGMSMGGGATWDYAGNSTETAARIAAIVPVCGASQPNSTRAHNIAVTDLPVWATHNQVDPQVPVSNTNGYVDLINADPTPPSPLAKKTIFPVQGHDAWTTTYNPDFRENGLNIYEWMLQYQRTQSAPLPVTLTEFDVRLAGGEVRISWKTSWEQNNHHFSIERSTDGDHFSNIGEVLALNQSSGGNYVYIDKNPSADKNYYRLWQTDLDGKKTMLGIRELLIDRGLRSLVLYPNPASDHFMLGINQPSAGPLTVQIINAQGKMVQRVQYVKLAGYWQQRISIAQLPPGIYTVHLKSDRFEIAQQLVKK